MHLVDAFEEANDKWIDLADFLCQKNILASLEVFEDGLSHESDDAVQPSIHNYIFEVLAHCFVDFGKVETSERVFL